MNVKSCSPGKLRGYIAERRVRQDDIAEKVGVHYTNLSLFLNEHRPMPAGLGEKIRKAIDDLVEERLQEERLARLKAARLQEERLQVARLKAERLKEERLQAKRLKGAQLVIMPGARR